MWPTEWNNNLFSKQSIYVHAQPCLTLCNPVDCSPPGSSVHGISQAEKPEQVAIPYSRGSSVSMSPGLAGGFFTTEPSRICLQYRRPGFNPWVWKIPGRREWLPTAVFLLGEFQGQRNLVGHSPWVAESDMTKQLTRCSQIPIPFHGTTMKWDSYKCKW